MLCKISIFVLPVQAHEIWMENFWCRRMASHFLKFLPFQRHRQIFVITDLLFCFQTKLAFYWNPKFKHYNFQQFNAFRILYFLQDLKNIFFEILIEPVVFMNLNFASLDFIRFLQLIFPSNLWVYYEEKTFRCWIHHFWF